MGRGTSVPLWNKRWILSKWVGTFALKNLDFIVCEVLNKTKQKIYNRRSWKCEDFYNGLALSLFRIYCLTVTLGFISQSLILAFRALASDVNPSLLADHQLLWHHSHSVWQTYLSVYPRPRVLN